MNFIYLKKKNYSHVNIDVNLKNAGKKFQMILAKAHQKEIQNKPDKFQDWKNA
jgi:hypothetical protein